MRRGRSLENDFAALSPGHRADVNDPVGGADNLLLVLHHHDRVAQVAQLLEHAHQQLGVAGVEADAGLVEDVERPHEVAAERGGQVYALAFAAA